MMDLGGSNIASRSTAAAVPTAANGPIQPGDYPRVFPSLHGGDGVERTSTIDFPAVGSADVAIFWDFENVRIPAWCPATAAADSIRSKVAKYGRIVEKRLYYDSRRPAELSVPRSDLDLSGFTLVDCPSRGRKETLDKKLIVDVLCFAWERSSMPGKACVVLITSDGDYSYTLARLRDIGVFTIIIYRPDVVANVLIENANVVMSWEYDVLGGPPASHGDDEDEDDDGRRSRKPSVAESTDGAATAPRSPTTPTKPETKQPNLQTRGKFALFCSVVLNAQHRNVRPGITVYSSWAGEALAASIFYTKLGEKDREGYESIRSLATTKGMIEWGRRDLKAPGKPVIKLKDREDKRDGLSPESYLRLTEYGLTLLKPEKSDWKNLPPIMEFGGLTIDHDKHISNAPGGHAQSIPPPPSSTNTEARSGKLFVAGLSHETTEDSLWGYFHRYGELTHILVKDGKNGKGFGFVFFDNPEDAEAVLNVEHHMVDRATISVKRYKETWRRPNFKEGWSQEREVAPP